MRRLSEIAASEAPVPVPASASAIPPASWVEHLLVLGFFVGWTAAWLWPLPVGGEAVVKAPYWWDAELNAYLLQEAGNNLVRGGPLYDARILHPAANVLALSENLFAWGLLSRLVPLGPVSTHNLLLWLGVAASGWSAFAYLRRRSSTFAALAGAVLFTYAPFRLGLLARLQLAVTVWVPVVLLVLESVLARPSFRRFLSVGLLALLQFTTGVYYAFHLAILSVPTVLVAGVRARWGARVWAGLVAAGLVTAVLAWPLVSPYLFVARDFGLERDARFISDTSGTFRDLVSPSTLQALWRPLAFEVNPYTAREPHSFPGLVLLLLAAWGGLVAWWRRREGLGGPAFFGVGWHAAWLLGALVLFLGTGEHSPGGAYAPFGWFRVVPALRGLRYPSRFIVLMVLMLAVFAAWAVDDLRRRVVRVGLGPVFVLLALAETWTVKMPLDRPVVPERILAEVAALPGDALLEWPFEKGEHAPRIVRDVAVLAHGKRTLSGYTGFDPPSWRVTREAMTRFPDAWSEAWLRRVGAKVVLVHLHEQRTAERTTSERRLRERGFTQVASDAAHTVWLVPEGDAGLDPSAPSLDDVKWLPRDAIESDGDARALFDDDPETRWTTARSQAPAVQGPEVRFRRPAALASVHFSLGRYPLDFPRGLRIEGRRGGTWSVLADAPLVVPVRGLAAAPTSLHLRFDVADPDPVEAVRFVFTGTTTQWASIGELSFGLR